MSPRYWIIESNAELGRLAGYLALAWAVSVVGLAFFRKSKKNFADVL